MVNRPNALIAHFTHPSKSTGPSASLSPPIAGRSSFTAQPVLGKAPLPSDIEFQFPQIHSSIVTIANFHPLHSEGAISVAMIVTRPASLQGNLPNDHRSACARNSRATESSMILPLVWHPAHQRGSEEFLESSAESIFVDAWTSKMVADIFGSATTHWNNRSRERLLRGRGQPLPDWC